jgi:hypothetical protein
VIGVDHEDCGAADSIVLLDVDRLPEALEMMRATGREEGLDITTEALDAAEFRWQVEKALDARAVHDSELSVEELVDGMATEEDGQVYPALARVS